MRRPAALLLALIALATLAACGDDAEEVSSGDDPGTTTPSSDPLAGRDLTVTASTGHQIVEGTTITLAFADGQVSVEAGCNHLSGAYSLDGDVLVVDALGGTEMGCDADRMEQDAWIASFLAERPTVAVRDDEVVTLTAGEEVLTLIEGPLVAPRALAGTWTLDTIIEGGGPDATASALPVGVTASITFSADGTYEVAAGCNTGSGTYAETGTGTYQIDPPALTRRRCADEAMEVEEGVVAVLDGEVSASIEGDRLTLEAADGSGLGLTAG